MANIGVSADSNIFWIKSVLGAGGCTFSPSRRSNRSCQGISWELQWKSLKNMTPVCSTPTHIFVIDFNINDFPQLLGSVIKIFLNFLLPLSRSVLMELQKLSMQILLLLKVRIAVLCQLLQSWIQSCVSIPWWSSSRVLRERMRSAGAVYNSIIVDISSETFLAPFVMMKS